VYWQGRAYEQTGRRDEAIAAYSEFIGYWKDADPEVRHFAEDARARLEELSGT